METAVERARHAAEQGAWVEAFDLFARLDASQLEAGDLDVMADAAWWSCLLDEAIAVRQKAYAAHLDAGNDRRAGYAAWQLSGDYGIKDDPSAASGWLRRAQRHLAGHEECVERGFLAITESDIARSSGDLEPARASAQLAVELGERCGSLDLHAMGIQTLGRALVASGDIRNGMALLDEAMTLVIAERLTPVFTGWIYCNVVATCMERADVRRAGEWTEAAMTWCGSISDLTPFHGICRMHRVEILSLRGEWDRAESEALRTAEEMERFEQHVVADATYAIGEISLRRGDLRRAEEWFTRAQELGRDPQPGLASVRLCQGKLDGAATGLRLSLAATPEPTVQRARLLATHVDVLLASREIDEAREAVLGLEAIASETSSDLIETIALIARAAVHLAAEEIEETLHAAKQAWSLAQQLKCSHLVAKARVIVGLASERAGDAERAQIELEAARAVFEQLGATLDARGVVEHLRRSSDLPGGLSERELEVLRLVAEGKTNGEIAAVMVISKHTVSRHLQNIFVKLDVSSRAAATAFAFEHDLV